MNQLERIVPAKTDDTKLRVAAVIVAG
ncbi:hypothetical protein PMI41_04923, partial [Phyllobacterium sp. YR531]